MSRERSHRQEARVLPLSRQRPEPIFVSTSQRRLPAAGRAGYGLSLAAAAAAIVLVATGFAGIATPLALAALALAIATRALAVRR